MNHKELIEKLYEDKIEFTKNEISYLARLLSEKSSSEKGSENNSFVPYNHSSNSCMEAMGFKDSDDAEDYVIDSNAKLSKLIRKAEKKSEAVELVEKFLLSDVKALRLFVHMLVERKNGGSRKSDIESSLGDLFS